MYDLDLQQTGTIIKQDHKRIIPAKYGQNPAISLGLDNVLSRWF